MKTQSKNINGDTGLIYVVIGILFISDMPVAGVCFLLAGFLYLFPELTSGLKKYLNKN
jgi:hypothetical protein